MTDPLLSYQTPAHSIKTGLVTATWIYLLVLGLLYCLVGTCGSASIVYLAFHPPRTLRVPPAILWAFAVFFFLFSIGSGTTFIWTGFLLRRLSRAAAIVAFVLALVNAGLALGYDVFNLVVYLRMAHPSMPLASAIASLVLYLLAAAVNAVGAILLWRLLRQMRRPAFSQSSDERGLP